MLSSFLGSGGALCLRKSPDRRGGVQETGTVTRRERFAAADRLQIECPQWSAPQEFRNPRESRIFNVCGGKPSLCRRQPVQTALLNNVNLPERNNFGERPGVSRQVRYSLSDVPISHDGNRGA